MENYAVVGKRLPRTDAIEKVTGETLFVSDFRLPHLLHCKILGSPLPHATITNIDTSKAERLLGVRAVITAEDTLKAKFGRMIADEYVLALDKVRFVGDEVAAVAAVDEDTAEEALQLIKVDYEELPAIFDPLQALAPDAPKIHDVNNNIAAKFDINRGNIDEAFRRADYIFEDTFTTSLVHPGYMEDISCVIEVDSSGRFQVHAGSQGPHRQRALLAKVLGVPLSKVHLINHHIGGGFGGKLEQKPAYICAFLAQKVGKPVKFTYSREETLAVSSSRVPTMLELKLGFNRDGKILAKQTRITSDNGAYTRMALAVLSTTAVRMDAVYRLENIRTEARLVYTNKVPTSTFRGFGNPQMAFAMESAMDMAAERLGMDPVELRRKNISHAGDITAHGWELNTCGLEECIDKATTSTDWQGKRRKSGNRGVGIACCVHVSGVRQVNFEGSTAIIKMNEDGSADLVTGEMEIGQGSSTVLPQMVAEELGLRLEDVRMPPVDTDVNPYCLGAYASRTTHIAGNTARVAAADVKRQLFEVAAERLEANEEDLEARDGQVYVKGSPEKAVSIAELVSLAILRQGGEPIIGKGAWDSDCVIPDPVTRYGNSSSAYPFAAHVAEVEVDPETGQVKLLNYVAAQDLGRAINPILAEGQIEGAISQGMGYALTEQLILQDGHVLNPNLASYKLVGAPDMPTTEITLVETNDPKGPFGAKGLGEPSLIPVAPAIVNAVYDAIGVRITDLPITPEKILKGLAGKNAKGL